MIVDGEVVVGGRLVGGRCLSVFGTRADAWGVFRLRCESVEHKGVGSGLRERGKVEPGDDTNEREWNASGKFERKHLSAKRQRGSHFSGI